MKKYFWKNGTTRSLPFFPNWFTNAISSHGGSDDANTEELVKDWSHALSRRSTGRLRRYEVLLINCWDDIDVSEIRIIIAMMPYMAQTLVVHGVGKKILHFLIQLSHLEG
jgi:hypothetical protein